MLRPTLILVFMFTSLFICHAQDILTKTNGEYVDIKVVEITESEIKYKAYENPDGPLLTIPRTEVVKIRYENGTVEQFQGSAAEKPVYPEYNSGQNNNNVTEEKTNTPALSDDEMYEMGKQDARKYYTKYKPAVNGTLATTLLCGGGFGLAVAIPTAVSSPKEQNFKTPHPEYLKNYEYKKGYRSEAHRIKAKKVWNVYKIGLAVNVVVIVMLAMAQ